MSYDMNQAAGNGQVGNGAGQGQPGMHHSHLPQHMQHPHLQAVQQMAPHHFGQAPPQQVVPQMQQAGVLYCNKHDQMINTFCMTHQVPLCQTCVRDHLHMQNPGNYHDATGQRAGQLVECDLLPIEQAINESLHRMQSSLQGVQEFIEFKKTLNDFPDAETLQIYLQQNQLFENAYSMAHRYFVNLQNLPDGQKELHLSQVNQSFIEEYKRFSQARQVIEVITGRRQQPHGYIQPVQSHPGNATNARQQASPAHVHSGHANAASANVYDQQDPEAAHYQQQQAQPPVEPAPQQQQWAQSQYVAQRQNASQANAPQQPPQQLSKNGQQHMPGIYQQNTSQSQQHAQPQQAYPQQHSVMAGQSSQQSAQPQQFYGHPSQHHQQQMQLPQLSQQQQQNQQSNQGQFQNSGQLAEKQMSSGQFAPSAVSLANQSEEAQQMHHPGAPPQSFAQPQSQKAGNNQNVVQQQQHPGQHSQQQMQPQQPIQPQQQMQQPHQPPIQQPQQQPQQTQQMQSSQKHRGLRLTVRIDLQLTQQLNFEIEVDPNQSLKQLQQNIKDDVAKLERNCSQAQLDKLQIYLCVDVTAKDEQAQNMFEIIPYQQWNGTLIECGLREGCVLYFSSRNLPLRSQQPQPNKSLRERDPTMTGRRDPSPNPPMIQHAQSKAQNGSVPQGLGSPQVMNNQQHGMVASSAAADKEKGGVAPIKQQVSNVSANNQQNLKKAKSLQVKPDKPERKDIDAPNLELNPSKSLKPERQKKVSAKKQHRTTQIFYRLYSQPKEVLTGAPEVLDSEFNEELGDNNKIAKAGAEDPNEEQYKNSVETHDKTRLKNLKRQILVDMNCADTCAVRLYKGNELLLGDMDFVKDLMIDRVDVELYYEIHIQVEGMGGQYQPTIQVNPNETVDSIRHKVPFFSLFSQRNYRLVTDSDTTLERDQLATLLFRDSGLRNGSRLKMVPPKREEENGNYRSSGEGQPDENDENDAEQQELDGGEEGMMFAGEGGEDEIVEMGEGGEDEMLQMEDEGGEEELLEDNQEEAESEHEAEDAPEEAPEEEENDIPAENQE